MMQQLFGYGYMEGRLQNEWVDNYSDCLSIQLVHGPGERDIDAVWRGLGVTI